MGRETELTRGRSGTYLNRFPFLTGNGDGAGTCSTIGKTKQLVSRVSFVLIAGEGDPMSRIR
jgi:hypothetical protein